MGIIPDDPDLSVFILGGYTDIYHLEAGLTAFPVPLPTAGLLFGSGILGLFGCRKRLTRSHREPVCLDSGAGA